MIIISFIFSFNDLMLTYIKYNKKVILNNCQWKSQFYKCSPIQYFYDMIFKNAHEYAKYNLFSCT